MINSIYSEMCENGVKVAKSKTSMTYSVYYIYTEGCKVVHIKNVYDL